MTLAVHDMSNDHVPKKFKFAKRSIISSTDECLKPNEKLSLAYHKNDETRLQHQPNFVLT